MATRLDRKDWIARLRAAGPVIMPSLLLCDFANLGQEVARVEAAGVGGLHFDVMDGHFVPNLTYGMPILQAVRPLTELPMDAHLMIERPERYVDQFRAAGADIITISAEAVDDPRPTLDLIRSLGAVAGLAIGLPTPLSSVERALPHCDLILVMSVMLGFGGQEFDHTALDKLRELRARGDVDLLLEVDGGVGPATIGACVEAGANMLVVGSAIFRADDYATSIHQLAALANTAVGTS